MNWWTNLSTQVQPQITILGLKLHFYGIIIALALLTATIIAQRRAKNYQLNQQIVESSIIWAFIPAVIGARIYHVIDHLAYYIRRPFDIVAIWQGGLGIYGALLGGLVGLLYAGYRQHIKIWPLLDLLAPSIAIAQAIGRWGNFFNQEAFGPPTDLPWKIYISPVHRISPYHNYDYFQPLFLYESLWNFLTFLILMIIARFRPSSSTIFSWYLILYGLGRFFIEFGRLDTAQLWGIKVAHLISLTMIVTGLLLLHRQKTLSLLKFSTKKNKSLRSVSVS